MSDEKVTITISKKSYEFLKSLATEIERQDNRATAKPYFFALRRDIVYPAADGYDNDGYWYKDRHGNEPFSSMEELLENDPEHDLELVEKIPYKSHQEVQNVFLTERGLLEHVRINRHNLGDMSEPKGFLYHAFRNEEFDNLFGFLQELAKENEKSIE
jgi:hypothetical protein